jgi:hypothetical protein
MFQSLSTLTDAEKVPAQVTLTSTNDVPDVSLADDKTTNPVLVEPCPLLTVIVAPTSQLHGPFGVVWYLKTSTFKEPEKPRCPPKVKSVKLVCHVTSSGVIADGL